MAKKGKQVQQEVQVEAPEVSVPKVAEKKASIGVRGPKGVDLTAKISLLATTNPKREGTKAYAVFSKYVNGMTVQEFMDAAGAEATPNIVYDAKHGYIAVNGYSVEVVAKKVRVPKAPKTPRAKKEKAVKAEPSPTDTELERETEEQEV